jgi:hypothetical protein
MSAEPRVALSQDFLLKLGKLPSAVQANIAKWALKFQQNPKAPGINYEAIKSARDQNLYSVRVDQDWRGIIFRPPTGDLYILLHVDKHDPAYRWAERRKLAVNPVTGAIQIVNLEAVEALPDASSAVQSAPAHAAHAHTAVAPAPSLFAQVSDEQLEQIGTPTELIPLVRTIASEADLDAAQPALPVEAYEGLFLLAAGDSVTQVLVARESRVDRKVDPTDFVAALETPESQSRFVVVTDDAAMSAILNAPLQQWRVFLHPTQRKLADGSRSGPVRVLGGAGTGKTVLALHRAAWLARNVVASEQKVLFTTFTKNLAFDIEQNLKSLMAGDPALDRIEVRNLDRWVHGYLHRQKYPHSIVYGLQPDLWKTALALAPASLGLDDSFYGDEWSQVITAQGVQTLDDYRRATRTGRRTVLTRAKRDQIWPVFEEYRLQLSSQRRKDADDAFGDAAALLASDAKKPYVAIVVDETQDFGPQALKLMRAMVAPGANDLFFVGDGHQRIYSRHRASMGKCGINIQGRSRKLYLNYRTTEEIRRTAVALLEGREIDDLDGGADDNSRYKSLSHGPAPEVVNVATADAGVNLAVARVGEWVKEPEAAAGSICVMAPTKKLRDAVGEQLASSGLAVSAIEVDAADTSSSDAVRVATMHRAKGLEFDRVVVLAPNGIDPSGDSDIAQLIYVSLTRAKTGAMLIR